MDFKESEKNTHDQSRAPMFRSILDDLQKELNAAATEEEKADILETIKSMSETIQRIEALFAEYKAVTEETNKNTAFYRRHADAIGVLYGEDRKDERDAFIDALTPSLCGSILEKDTLSDKLKEVLSFKAKTPDDREYKAASVYELFSIQQLVLLYERLQAIGKKQPLSKPQKVKMMNDIVPNTMLASDGFLQHIIGSEIDGQLKLVWQKSQSDKEGNESYSIMFSLSYENLSPEARKRFDPFDLTILNHIGSIMYYQQLATGKATLDITANELWGMITGAKDLSKVSPRPEKLEQLSKRLERLESMKLDMDITEEILKSEYKFRDERLVSGKVEDRMLHYAKAHFLTAKGRLVQGYHFYALPILYAYCLSKKHTITVPSSYLEIEGRADERTITFRDYLVKEIVRIKRGERSSAFLLSTIYEKTGTPEPKERVLQRGTKAKKVDPASNSFKSQVSQEIAADCERIKKILDTWIKNGIIYGYEQKGRGMKIKFNVVTRSPESLEDKGEETEK